MKKATPIGSSPNKSQRKSNKNKPGKLVSMLTHFANGKRLHRFQAERLGDHCLPTSASDLQIKYGLYFSRKMIKVPNRFGSMTSVMLYWLEGKELERAREIVGIVDAA
ncbi:hypothetical protein [Aurantivibrio infirmus]